MTHNRVWWATAAPSILGAGFPILVKLDQMMLRAGWISQRAAIGIEFLYLLACFVVFFAAILITVRMVRSGERVSIPGVVLGLIIWVALLFVGFSNGPAVVYAT